MTKATCATVASALVTAGYSPSVYLDQSGAYHVAVAVTSGVAASTLATFATAQSVAANVTAVDFV